ncbi:DUF3520 domain-containing protein [Flavobacteriaceae bacterium AU392]|nr:DUF3520 domain-containing protein [Flavobacteriaceae bacterium]RKM85435.1 DUF3520 domain-containing protein [Flavobacteriaceae bacterium AU392]
MRKLILIVCALTISLQIQAQEKVIRGTVTFSEDGLPLPGTSVLVKKTKRGVQTDFDGNYELKASIGEILVFSLIGYKNEEVVVGSSNRIDVSLDLDIKALEEVVVTGYATTSKIQLTGAVSSMSGKKKVKPSLGQVLQGQTSGIQVTSANGTAGALTSITIRGVNSINSNKPLYIVDGIPVNETDFNSLTPKKIKDIKVFKNDKASALYGSKGANGVIVISTKGKKQQTDLSIIEDFYNESYAQINENSFERTNLSPLSTFSIDVDKASYSNIRRMINKGQKIPYDAVKIEEMINYFDYNYPQPSDNHPFSINTEVAQTPWNIDTKIVKIGLQGKTYENDALPASNLTFLIDVSGSMGAHNKLQLLKPAFKLLVNQLRKKDKVSIVVYAGAAGVVLEPTSGDKKEKIMEALDNLQSGGSTAGGAGIKLAYKLAQEHFIKNGNNRVILATDGDFNVGASSDKAMEKLIEEKRKSGVFLSVLGFGYGNYKDSKLETLADKGNGNHAYIDNLQEAQKVFGKEFGGTLYTIAKDVKIQVEFNPKKVQAYRLIGYENRLLADEDFIDDTKDAGELGSGHTVTALYEIIPVGIKSDYLKEVDDLKYTETTPTNKYSDELLTVKFRYKKPSEDESIEMIHTLKDELKEASSDLKFASAVALFGMQLRHSKYYNNSKIEDIITLANAARDNDKEGYKAEFIRLVSLYENL